MHNNYYFLRQLSEDLQNRLEGFEVAECFSQNKNELIIGFTKSDKEFFIKANLTPSFCCLFFPETFQRARKNSVDLFPETVGLTVVKIKQYLNERAFAIYLNNGSKLLFKMHGNRSNIILYGHENQVKKLFNSHLKNDYELDITTLDRPIDQRKEAFMSAESYQKVFPTFGKVIKNHLKQIDYDSSSKESQWELIQQILSQFEKPQYYIVERDQQLYLSLINEDHVIKKYENPLEAINDFFTLYISTDSLRRLKKNHLSQIDKSIKQSQNYLSKAKRKLQSITNNTNYSQWADIIMANLHQLKTGQTETTLANFYQGNELITIKLKKSLSPQKNAEVYYRKAKNQAREVANLEESISSKEQLLAISKKHHKNVEAAEDFRELKNYLKKNQLEHKQGLKQQPMPYNEFYFNGFAVFVGKNAKSNDALLRGYTYKEDLWLHAKDVSGSHVIIKHQAGKGFPKDVIEKAAQLAAYYSKRKTDSLCPVIVTPRKFVRKRKGDPAGAVVVDKEDVILVEPKSDDS